MEATDNTYLVTVAGSVGIGQKVGIGASVAYNNVSRQTEAVIGNHYDNTSDSTTGSFNAGGSIQIDASNGGFLGAFAVAGAKETAPDAQQGGAGGGPAPLAPVNTSVAIAVGFAHNTVDDSVRAYINGATVSAAGAITLSAQFTPVIEAFSIGGSYASGQQTSVALSGAGSTNNVDVPVLAFIAQSVVTTQSVQATNGGVIADGQRRVERLRPGRGRLAGLDEQQRRATSRCRCRWGSRSPRT